MRQVPFSSLEELLQAASLNDVHKTISSDAGDMGFDYFCYHVIRPPAGPRLPVFVTNYPRDWARYYTAAGYLDVDPVVSRAWRSGSPFLWSELRKKDRLSHTQMKLLNECGDARLRQGITIPTHGPNSSLAMTTFSADVEEKEFARRWKAHQIAIRIIAQCCHEAVTRIAPKGWEESRIKALSARERECLLWASRGKTAWESAQIIGLRERTINFYIENAMKKLGVNSKIHAVVKAIMSGAITP